jgi:hypothetical protein
VREAVGLFHDHSSLQAAADELMINGFDRSHLSLLAGDEAVQRHLGHLYERVEELENEPRAAFRAYVGTDSLTEAQGVLVGGLFYVGALAAAGSIVASGGTIGVLLLGAAAAGGAGGLVGAALARIIGQRHARSMQRHLDRGGLILWVHTEDAEHESRAMEILQRHSAEDVDVHELPPLQAQHRGGLSHKLSFMNRLGM